MQAVYGPFVALLPFRWKRHFMAVRGVEFYSDKLQCRYFKSMVLAGKEERVDLVKNHMSAKAINLLWAENIVDWSIREEIIMAGVTLNDEQFKLLDRKRGNSAYQGVSGKEDSFRSHAADAVVSTIR